jgi:ubiquinone/menaquinone biosynthesis C-methylase UbiE
MTDLDTYIQYARQTLADFRSSGDEQIALLVNEINDAEVKRVLDVGCGAGLQLVPFAEQKNSFCVGIDIGAEVGEVGEMIFREQGLAGRGAFFRAQGEALPFADSSFDVVICRVALPYMDNHRALSEIARVLRPGGNFFLKIHAPRFYWGMIRERAKTLDPKQLAYPLICLTAGTINRLSGKHPRGNFWKGKEVYQTRRSLARELEKRGMRIIKELPDTNNGTPSFLIEKRADRKF